jgi:diadenylate cyclase
MITERIAQEFKRLGEWLALESGPLLLLDIGIVLGLFYWVYTYIRGTRATRILFGIIIVEAAMLIARFSNLQILSWVMSKALTVLLVAIPIIFQPELRRLLGKIGDTGLSGRLLKSKGPSFSTVTEIVRACEGMVQGQLGAIIIVKRRGGLEGIIESGTVIDARVSARLIRSLFAPHSELHDGAVVIEGDRLVAAGCFYVSELSDAAVVRGGARHRAAVGFSLESDALVISISQDRGIISLVLDGKVVEGVSGAELEESLSRLAAPRPLPKVKKGERRKADRRGRAKR